MDAEQTFPIIRQTVLDTTDPRGLAEFYRQLFGLSYRPGDEPPPPGQPDERGDDWLVLHNPAGGGAAGDLAFQKVAELPESTWPEEGTPQQLHLDSTVATAEDLAAQHERALALGARMLLDRSADEDEPLYVYADPAGHPFCIFVA
jgi:Glyoxalase-like domain